MKNSLLYNILFACTFFTLTINCSGPNIDHSFGTTILDTMSNEKLQGNTRAFIEDSEDHEPKVTFTVIYSGDLENMKTADSEFRILLETYSLEITKPFEIDEENKGFVLVATTKLVAPIEVGKEISLLDQVLMVEVDNVKKETKRSVS